MNFERVYTPQQLLEFSLISTDQETRIRTTGLPGKRTLCLVMKPGEMTADGND